MAEQLMLEGMPPRRKGIRLPDYDYAQVGTYAFTVVVHRRRCCLGEVEDVEFWPSSAGEIVRSLKAASTTRTRKECIPNFQWQERYWDRIVRSEAEFERFRAYIVTNPARWTLDREYADQ